MSKSQILTNVLRRNIVNLATKAAFETKVNKLDEEEHQLAEKAYNAMLGKHKKAFLLLPKSFVKCTNSFYLNVKGKSILLQFNKNQIMPFNNPSNRYVVKQTALIKSIIALVEHKEKLKEKRRSFGRNTRSLLASVNTTKALIEVWPEAIKYIPKESIAAANALVPMNLVRDLNRTIAAA